MQHQDSVTPVADARRLAYLGFLGLLFVASFAVPLLFAATFGKHRSSEPDQAAGADSVFPHARLVTKDGGSIIVRDGPTINPVQGDDFIVAVWINLKKAPRPDEAISLFSKLDPRFRLKPGYALYLSSDRDSVVPIVHWRDGSVARGGLLFSPFPVIPGVWTLFVLSVLDGQFIGMHAGAMVEEGKINLTLLGGYDLEKPVTPEGRSDLVFADFHHDFRGKLGPVAIIKGTGINSVLQDILSSLAQRPLQKPTLPSTASLSLFIRDGATDESGSLTEIVTKKEGKGKKNRSPEAPASEGING